jgi:RHS repeat-associated protein
MAAGWGGDFILNNCQTIIALYDATGNLNERTNNTLLQSFNVNNLNELTTVTNGGRLTVAGSTTSPATNVTVNTSNAVLYADVTFASTNQPWANGNNTYTAIAHDVYGRSSTNSLTVSLNGTNSYTYDLNGNLLSDGTRSFAYDDENELIGVEVASAWSNNFVYDGMMRRRIERDYTWSSGSWLLASETHFIYDGNVVMQERNVNNLPTVTYTRGNDLSGTLQGAGGVGGLLARTDNSLLLTPNSCLPASASYHSDGDGNVTCLMYTNGVLAAKYLYDPFGNTLAQYGSLASANYYRFSSKEWSADSGLYYYLYRFYNPNLQRWLNRDPIEENGGINLSEFAANNPDDNVDALGEDIGIYGGGTINENQWTVNLSSPPNQVEDPVGMAAKYFLGQGQSASLSPQYVGIVENSPEVELFKDNLKSSAESRMCKTPCGQSGSYSPAPLNDNDYHPFSSWTGNWQLYALGEVTWHGNSDGSGGCNVSAHESIKGYASKTYTFAVTPGGNPWNIVPTILLVPSVAYITGGGSYFISGDFDIEFDFTHNCPCHNTYQ